MAFLPGIFGKQAAPQQQAPAQPAQPAPQPGPAASQSTPVNPAANPANMTGQPAQPPAGGPVNPLDSFADMFKPKAVDPNAPKTPTLADPILGQLDPTQFRQQLEYLKSGAPPGTTKTKTRGTAAITGCRAPRLFVNEVRPC